MQTNRPFKNTRKNLRRGSVLPKNTEKRTSPLNCYDCLDEVSCEEVSTANRLDLQRKPSDLSALPEDVIYIILEYLPINTRLAILRHKYNPTIMRHKLRDASIDKLFECAKIAKSVLHAVFGKRHDVFGQLSSYIFDIFEEDRTIYLDFRKEQFINWIFVAMKRYTTIYKKKYTPSTNEHMRILKWVHLLIVPNKIANDSHVIEVMMLILYGRLLI